MNFCTWVIGTIHKDLTLFNISSYRASNFLKDCFFQTDFFNTSLQTADFSIGSGEWIKQWLRNAILWIIFLVVQGQNDSMILWFYVPVIPVQGNAMYFLGAYTRNKPAWHEGELQSECDVQVIYFYDFLIKTSLDCLFPNWKSTRDSISNLVLFRGKQTQYKAKVGGWVSVCGVATYGMNKVQTTNRHMGWLQKI